MNVFVGSCVTSPGPYDLRPPTPVRRGQPRRAASLARGTSVRIRPVPRVSEGALIARRSTCVWDTARVLGLVLDLFDVFDRSDTLYAAYKGAWKRRMATGDDDLGLLEAEMKNRNVPGAYDPHDSRRIAPAVRAWAGGIAPREARSDIKHAPKHRDEM